MVSKGVMPALAAPQKLASEQAAQLCCTSRGNRSSNCRGVTVEHSVINVNAQWPNHRIHGLKVDELIFCTEGGLGFGPVLRHHIQSPTLLGWAFSHLGFPQAMRGFRRFCVCHRRRQACHKAPAYPVSLTLSRSGFSKNIRELRQPSTRRNPFTTSACYRSAAPGLTHGPPAANSRTR